ncbi:CCA tRNA nucleotidyltransferase [Macrococcus equi]|uniref:CCA tRNA nucleotidyltransferase n=1 Tax=Macrococcus equi TaxID=3395462 RepID=UPI0039BE6DFC
MFLEKTDLNQATKNLFYAAQAVIHHIESQGYKAYIVGGAVRNILLDKPVNDIDITTNCLPEEIINIFDRTIPVGIEHGTVLVLWEEYQFEITTFRKDGDYHDHRRPDQVYFVSDLKSDLKRRDFTINALAIDESGEIIDYFEGQDDLLQKNIRAVGDAEQRFQEDALRMIRAIRFQSVLNFDIEENTLNAIHKLSPMVEHVSIERIVIEFKKMIEGTGNSKALQIFYQEMYRYIPFFKCLKNDLKKYQIHHATTFEIYLGYIIFCETNECIKRLPNLKISNQEKNLIKTYADIFRYFNFPGYSIRQFVYRYEINLIKDVLKFIHHEKLDLNNMIDIQLLKENYHLLPIHSRSELAINGHDLMIHLGKKQGAWLKQTLEDIENEVIEGRLTNNREKILEWTKQNV